PEDDHLRLRRNLRFRFRFVRRIEVRRLRGELGGTGIHATVNRVHPELLAELGDFALGRVPERGELAVAEAESLALEEKLLAELGRGADDRFVPDDAIELRDEPRIDARELVDALGSDAHAQ